ncbi:DEAD/DEAH box helicase [Psychrosphaera sp. B3R10]|nr:MULTISPECIES: DEAD/DEAH box helicase [unclassified Psychrosphaera]MBU2883035.1 DEAD/DEAH box helicase [Psychrosphaera sp. I2R16]MBU2988492.1 DEAD/DEAH box helicase [Psychrosphaera sp. B3R10]MDO6721034.1 DEAD/DEAH box helicase [Psychrosphaera sp. 1_MG-2023]
MTENVTPQPNAAVVAEATELKFADLGLSPEVLDAVHSVGYETPSPIQAECIPHILNGDDVLGIAQTGTGKTAAFALPALCKLDAKINSPQVLVLTPTRELAIQVAEAFSTYAEKLSGFHVLPIYGGQDFRTQLRSLKRGVHVVVGTPGRVMDHMRRETLDLSNLKMVILDEADEMLRMGFIDDVEWIMEHVPKQAQIALFSATMPAQILKVTKNYLKNPKEVRIKPKTASHSNITQQYWIVNNNQKLDVLTRILELIQFDGMIIFVKTRISTSELADKLSARGYAAAALNGDMNQSHREQCIESLKSGRLDIIIATDVAARGIDVERVSHVINYDLPYDVESYVHRVGRTGRAGRKGNAILFAAPRERRLLKTIERETKQTILPYEAPSNEEVTQLRVSSFKEKISDALGSQELEFFQKLAIEYAEEHQMDVAEVAGALTYLAQQEAPLQVTGKGMPGHNNGDDRGDRGPRDRNDRGPRDRNDRGDRGGRDGGRGRDPGMKMQAYRIEVGREHGVSPKDIVGAIANEANISSRFIGNIKLAPNFSIVELPAEMPADVQQKLKQTKIRNQTIDLKVDPRGGEGVGRREGGGGRDGGRGRDDRGGRGRGRDGGRSGGGEGHRGRRSEK